MSTLDDDAGREDDEMPGRCNARNRGARPGRCRRGAGQGTEHVGIGRCNLHGGNTTNHQIAAQRVLAERAVQTYGARVDIPTSQALLEEFAWAVGHVRWLRDIVAEIDPDALVWGKTEEADKQAGEFPGVDTKRQAAPNVWLDLYHKERRLLLDLAKTIDALKLEQRKVEWAEKQGAQFAAVIQAFTARLGLSAEQAVLVPAALREAIGSVVGPQVIEGQVA